MTSFTTLQPQAATISAADGSVLWPWLLPGTGAAHAWLQEQGCSTGQRVGVCLPNSPALACLLQAAPLAGLTLVIVNHRLLEAEREALFASAACDHRIGDGGIAVPACFAGDAPLAADHHLPAPEDAALVLFTSGTSGTPRAARLSVGAMAAASRAACTALELSPTSHWLMPLPLDHIGGAASIWRACWSGCALTIVDRFDAAAVNAHLDQQPITGVSLVPTMLQRLIIERDGRAWPAALRTILTGGAALLPATATACAELGRPPCRTYGCTEFASMVTVAAADGDTAGHSGAALASVELRIGARGTIELRGPAAFSGYEQNGELGEPHPAAAWFDTGDGGSLDDDGRLRVHGRRDDLLITGGENVYPAEIEATLLSHPHISACAVVGLDDADWGQVLAAACVGAADPDIDSWASVRFAPHKRPRYWLWLDALPLTPRGKIDRRALRRQFAAARSET